MAYISSKNLWESEFDNTVLKKHKVQDININQLKLEVHGSYRKDQKIATIFDPVNTDDVINKAFLEEKISKIQGHTFYIQKK